jgi:hypothetical protein
MRSGHARQAMFHDLIIEMLSSELHCVVGSHDRLVQPVRHYVNLYLELVCFKPTEI